MVQNSTVKLTILVAEDEPAMLSLVARHLKSQGFRVLEAPDGGEAWRLAQECAPDLVVLDVMMPEMSGWDVCHRIKARVPGSALARTGVIMLTGIGESLNELTSPLFEADEHLDKPFDFADLDAAVRRTLAHYGKVALLPDAAPPAPAVSPASRRAPAKAPKAKSVPAKKAPASGALVTKPVADKKAAAKGRAKPAR